MHFDHKPGAVLQIDFAGDNLHYVDKVTGEIKDCPVLVCVFHTVTTCTLRRLLRQSRIAYLQP